MSVPPRKEMSAQCSPGRLLWITPDRVFYMGLLGAPAPRFMGSLTIYVAVEGGISISIDDAPWQNTEIAIVQPYVAHRVSSEAREIIVITIEAETVDLDALPPLLRQSGAVDEVEFVLRVHRCWLNLCSGGRAAELPFLNFDCLFFGESLLRRRIDARIQTVIDTIKRDAAAPFSADACAELANLSFSRFLHLFKQEVGVPFRIFRAWKRARTLLHYVTRNANLTHVALDAGYPNSAHFSHSIRQAYGLKPKDIFAGSRRLAVLANNSPIEGEDI